jgi:hypothetical protein
MKKGTCIKRVLKQLYKDIEEDYLAFMPRQPRLDAPGVLHHVKGRGIARIKIFRSDSDREDFLDRLATLYRGGHLRR